MITDEKLGELVARAAMAVAKGMGRTVTLPEHVAIASPVVAVVLEEMIKVENYRGSEVPIVVPAGIADAGNALV